MRFMKSVGPWRRLTSTLAAYIVGIPMAIAGMAHAANPMFFMGSVIQYDLIPYGLAVWISVILPSTEIAVASMLLLNIERQAGFQLGLVLTSIFVVAQLSVLVRGLSIDCGCFGALSERTVGTESLLLAIGLLVSSAAGVLIRRKSAVSG
jgi:putative oxidoreductase